MTRGRGTVRTVRIAGVAATVALLGVLAGAVGPVPAGRCVPGMPAPRIASAAETAVPDRVAPLEEYRDRIRKAQAVVRDGYRTAIVSASAAQEIAFSVDEYLPAIEVVAVGGRRITVDNSVLRSLVERVRSSPTPDGREQALTQMNDHLASLLAAVGTGARSGIPEDRAALERLLAGQAMNRDPAISRRISEMVDRVVQWIGERWGAVTATPAGRFLADALWWAIVLILVLLLGLLSWQAVVRIRAALASSDPAASVGGPSGTAAPEEPLPADALSHADGLASHGRFRDGVRALMRGSVRALRHAGLLRRTRARTTSELLGQLAGADTAVLTPMRGLSVRFDRAWYGHADPGPAGFDEARREYEALAGALAGLESAEERIGGSPDPDQGSDTSLGGGET
jgi:hypothetical protein